MLHDDKHKMRQKNRYNRHNNQQQHQLHYTSVSEYNTIGWDGKCQYALQRDAFRESFLLGDCQYFQLMFLFDE